MKRPFTFNTQTGRIIVNAIFMQIGWFATAFSVADGRPWIGPLVISLYLLLHFIWSPAPKRELQYILLAGLIGTGIDSLKKATGLITYLSDVPDIAWLAPIWITTLWLMFATTFQASLKWTQDRYLIAGILGGIFAPLNYLAGVRLGGIIFNYNTALTMTILILIWAIVTPGLAWLAKKMNN